MRAKDCSRVPGTHRYVVRFEDGRFMTVYSNGTDNARKRAEKLRAEKDAKIEARRELKCNKPL